MTSRFYIWAFILTPVFLVSCLKNRIEGDAAPIVDGFETINSIEDITEATDAQWTYTQVTEDGNYIAIDTTFEFNGQQCLKFVAVPSEDGASKCDIANNDKLYKDGQTVYFSGMFYIEGTSDLDQIFFFDIEESVAIGAGPGLRFRLEGDPGGIGIERGKMLESNISQSGTMLDFPRNQWVQVEIEVYLSQKKKGWIKVIQNGTTVIDVADIRTLPVDKSTLIQGTKGIYNNVQVGITANSPNNEAVMYVDDVVIRVN